MHYNPEGSIQPASLNISNLNTMGCREEQKVNGIYYGIPITDRQTDRQTNTFDPLTP